MASKTLNDYDTYLEFVYNDTSTSYTNDEEYFFLSGNHSNYPYLRTILFKEAQLLYGRSNTYIKEVLHEGQFVLVIQHAKLLPVLSYFSNNHASGNTKLKVTGPVLKRGSDGKPIKVLKTIIIDASKPFGYKNAGIFVHTKNASSRSSSKR